MEDQQVSCVTRAQGGGVRLKKSLKVTCWNEYCPVDSRDFFREHFQWWSCDPERKSKGWGVAGGAAGPGPQQESRQ